MITTPESCLYYTTTVRWGGSVFIGDKKSRCACGGPIGSSEGSWDYHPFQTTLPKSFWDYALETDARILNMVLTKKVYEALVKRDTLTKPDKLEPRSIKCIFIGYPKETMGYSFYYPPKNKVLVAQNAEFLENSLITQEASGSLEDLEIIHEEDTHSK
ncbi:hypothetical protein Tco_0209401 [Tanacetum coccineum]